MRILLIFISICFSTLCFNQERLKGYVEIIQNVNQNFTYTESNLNFGINYAFANSSISVFSSYVYGGVSAETASYSHFKLDYHLLGGGLKVKFRDENKLYNPLIKFSVLTEIASKYRGGKLMKSYAGDKTEINFLPTKSNYAKTYNEGYPTTTKVDFYYSYHYISTPLIVSLFFDNEFKINEKISLNVGIGYLLRKVRYAYNQWGVDELEPEVELSQTHSLKESTNRGVENIGHLEFELGINYTFSFNKNTD